jgi:hypothetical protein
MWSFDSEPDEFGQWNFEECNSDGSLSAFSNDSRLHLCLPRKCPDQSFGGAGLLAPVIQCFESALRCDHECKAADIHTEAFLDGLDSFVEVLDRIGWNLGSCLLAPDARKLRRSRARDNGGSYRAWLMSEIPIHVATGYEEYVDDSAAMANLWSARTLEFFVHVFSLLCDGKETSQSTDFAYARTLQKHHSFFQRQAFWFVVGQMPVRQQMLKLLEGDSASWEVVLRELTEFKDCGRQLSTLCFQMDDEISTRLHSNRDLLQMDEAYGKA